MIRILIALILLLNSLAYAQVDYSSTPNLGLKKPTVGLRPAKPTTDPNNPANLINANFDLIDTYVGVVADVRAHGAACDGVADDTAEIQAAIDANKLVLIPDGTCVISSGLTVPASHVLRGLGITTSVLSYTGTSGYAITFGSTSGGSFAYGIGGGDFRLNLTQNGASGIRVAGTADFHLTNIYMEGIPATNTSTGLYFDGAVASNIGSNITNININHFKFPVEISSSGVGQVTSINTFNLKVLCDDISGSIGINIVATHGDGNVFTGGNIESCDQGIKTAATRSAFKGVRFEGNTTDVRLEATAVANNFEGNINLTTLSDASGSVSNAFIANQDESGSAQFTNKLQQLTLNGDLTLLRAQAANRYIILSDVTTGTVVMQAGPGSAELGGSILLRGSSHAGNGSVIAGLGGTGARSFCVNSGGLGAGTDLFCVDQAGQAKHAGVLFAALGTPSNGTVAYCSDCNKATPCTSGGAGAFAKRLNGAWDCD